MRVNYSSPHANRPAINFSDEITAPVATELSIRSEVSFQSGLEQ